MVTVVRAEPNCSPLAAALEMRALDRERRGVDGVPVGADRLGSGKDVGGGVGTSGASSGSCATATGTGTSPRPVSLPVST